MAQQTILIEQTAKRIKLAELLTLTALFVCIAAGLGMMYLWLPLGIAMFILAAIAFLGFIIVRIYRWWHHG